MIIGYKYWLEGTVDWFLTLECWSAKWALETQVSSHAVYPDITCLMCSSKHEVWRLVLILIQDHHLTDCRPPAYVPFAESTCLDWRKNSSIKAAAGSVNEQINQRWVSSRWPQVTVTSHPKSPPLYHWSILRDFFCIMQPFYCISTAGFCTILQ